MICKIHLFLQLGFFNAMKIYTMMFIISYHYGIKCLHLLQLEPCNFMFKVISDITAHWYDL